ncbi:MAG: ribosome small subunit-dependent GTPase [Actinoallomurus sp.]|jgi:ribosome biogenesis GTPase|nr:ribosome small subunit-dependent GTPase [Actinoallomurus sp.]
MARDWARLDEDDVRVRPGKGSRPRTRRRPAHEDAVGGFVMAVDRGRYTCLVADRPVTAMRARELGRKSVVVGDQVRLVGDVSGRPDTLARVVSIDPRTSTLRRTADDSDPIERVIVANADNLVIVTALADPEPRPRMIDRCLVAAFDSGLSPLLCLTKADLAPPDTLVEMYAPLGVSYVVTRKDEPVGVLRERLAGRMSVLVGHSGVGKSTLVNALVPDAERAVSEVNPVTGRGRHTSSSAIALKLPGGDGWIIDTPGVRSFGLAHVKPDDVLAAFPDLIEGDAECPPHCTHLQADCALDAWVAAGHADPSRLDSLRRLLLSRDTDEV